MALTGNTYAIYYGWLADDESGVPNDEALRIAALRVPLLVANLWTAEPERHRNLSAPVLAAMRSAGTDVFAYVPTQCGKRDRQEVERDIEECVAAGAEGIFFDEADPLRETTCIDYYAALAKRIRAEGKRVILNPGVAQCGERIMSLCDVLMVEHRWRDLREGSVWMMRYPPERFMGVSSNEENAMGYVVDAQRAIADTREAWTRGIGWHTSTDRYVELPAWFETYVQGVRQ